MLKSDLVQTDKHSTSDMQPKNLQFLGRTNHSVPRSSHGNKPAACCN